MSFLADVGLQFQRAEGVEPITTVIRNGRLIWYRHVMRIV